MNKCITCGQDDASHFDTGSGYQCEACYEESKKDDVVTCEECCTPTGGPDICQECCDHSDCDDHCCLICEKDMSEEFAGRAEWAAECAGDR